MTMKNLLTVDSEGRTGDPPKHGQETALEHCRPTEDFHWYKIGKDVGNVRNQGPHLIEPLSLPSDVDD